MRFQWTDEQRMRLREDAAQPGPGAARAKALLALANGDTIADVARAAHVSVATLYRWRDEFRRVDPTPERATTTRAPPLNAALLDRDVAIASFLQRTRADPEADELVRYAVMQYQWLEVVGHVVRQLLRLARAGRHRSSEFRQLLASVPPAARLDPYASSFLDAAERLPDADDDEIDRLLANEPAVDMFDYGESAGPARVGAAKPFVEKFDPTLTAEESEKQWKHAIRSNEAAIRRGRRRGAAPLISQRVFLWTLVWLWRAAGRKPLSAGDVALLAEIHGIHVRARPAKNEHVGQSGPAVAWASLLEEADAAMGAAAELSRDVMMDLRPETRIIHHLMADLGPEPADVVDRLLALMQAVPKGSAAGSPAAE
jgi:transposase-like protein